MPRFIQTSLLVVSLTAMTAPSQGLAGNPLKFAADSGLETLATGLPDDFRQHFFNLPLAVRVELDGRLLGDAMVLLSERGTLQLLEFTETGDSPYTDADRNRWRDALGKEQGVMLGAADDRHRSTLLALHYNLQTSLVSIVTAVAEHSTAADDYYALPAGGSSGLILRNNLNLTGGGNQPLAGRYGVEAHGSIGDWTAAASLETYQSGGRYGERSHALQNLSLQRELDRHFIKVGYFTPSTQGVMRLPSTRGGYAATVVGLMAGSSDTLAVDRESAGVYPVYVTASRQATVEIYRDGVLIDSQAVASGLQVIDTRRLPAGIYEVELRIVQDGEIAGRSRELIYKPANWRNPQQRWRYTLFAGRRQNLFSSHASAQAGDLAAGGGINYLLHPRAVLGLSLQQLGRQTQLGGSIDWQASDNLSLYGNLFQTSGYGTGIDAYGTFRYGAGSVGFSHSRAWLAQRDPARNRGDNRHRDDAGATGNLQRQREHRREVDARLRRVHTSALNLHHRLSRDTMIGGRIAHSRGAVNGVGIDLSLERRLSVFDSEATLRLSLFERPAGGNSRNAHRHGRGDGNRRNRGFDLTLNMALGHDGRQYSGSFGSRTDAGRRDQYVSVTARRQFADGALKNVAATATGDRYGLGLSGSGSFERQYVRGSGHLQRSSRNGGISGGLNLDSTVAIADGHVAADGQSAAAYAETGLIVDVESDVPDLTLRADDSGGPSARLRKGRNFIPVTAYRAGRVQFDFVGNAAPAAVITPATGAYHLNRGGVAYHRISVLKTVTVMGRLLDAEGAPLPGAHVINHAGRSVTHADGFFAVEMQEKNPVLEVRRDDAGLCTIRLDGPRQEREGDTLMAGDLLCAPPAAPAADNTNQTGNDHVE